MLLSFTPRAARRIPDQSESAADTYSMFKHKGGLIWLEIASIRAFQEQLL